MIDLRFREMEASNRVRVADPKKPLIKNGFGARWTTVLDDIEREFAHLEAYNVVIEAGFKRSEIRNDGWPRSNAVPQWSDIRIYFDSTTKGPLRYECAAFADWHDNVRAIGLVLQDLRLMSQRGVGSGSEQYQGFAALPESKQAGARGKRCGNCWVKTRHAMPNRCGRSSVNWPCHHPRLGGDMATMQRINEAVAQIEKEAAQ